MKTLTQAAAVASLALCLLPSAVSAVVGPVDDPVFGTGALTRDYDNWLDWLDWTLTTSRTYNDVASQLGPGGEFEGWHHATEEEFLGLYVSAGIDPSLINPPTNSGVLSDPTVTALANLLGLTWPSAGLARATSAEADRQMHFMGQVLTVPVLGGPEGDESVGAHTPRADGLINDMHSMSSTGHALVRVVPEPATLSLLAIGALLLLRRARRAALVGILAVILVLGVLASGASADLTIHLRLAETPDVNGGAVALTGPGQVVDMQIWAAVDDGNGDLSDDGLRRFHSAFYSSDGGAMLGDLSAAWLPDPPGVLWSEAPGASLGYQNDLEGEIDLSHPGEPNHSEYHFIPGSGDGDLDIGHTDRTLPPPPWFKAANGFGTQFTENPWDPNSPAVNEWNVANIHFEATGWGPEYHPGGPSGVTEVWAQPRQFAGAVWEEDGVVKFNLIDPIPGDPNAGDLVGGERILLYLPSAAQAPDGGPDGFKIAPWDPALVLDGLASTGSINWWGWDFDGDGDNEIVGSDGLVEVTYADLEAYGLERDVPYVARMTVGWSASDPMNLSTDTFNLTLVPEPGTLALLALGSLTLLRRRRAASTRHAGHQH